MKYLLIMMFLIGCSTTQPTVKTKEVKRDNIQYSSYSNYYNGSSCYGNGKLSCKIKEANKRLDSINKHLLDIDNILSCCDSGYWFKNLS